MDAVILSNSAERESRSASELLLKNVDTEATVELDPSLLHHLARRPVRASRVRRGYEVLKRGTDIVGALALLVLFMPLMLCIAAAVRLSSSGPVIYVQRRLTRGGKVFSMYKFRTMRPDAELGSGPVWAQADDPRVTRLGKVLRAYRLDELPQLWNVVKGDMSLIGPRPERPELAAQLEKELPGFTRRLEVKGGITGLAQVSAGYAACGESYRNKLALDLEYVNNRSFGLDIRIAFRTVVVMLTGFGAR